MTRICRWYAKNLCEFTLDKYLSFCYDRASNTVMGRSKRPDSRQRAAGWCKAVGKSAEIPPGVAFLKFETQK